MGGLKQSMGATYLSDWMGKKNMEKPGLEVPLGGKGLSYPTRVILFNVFN